MTEVQIPTGAEEFKERIARKAYELFEQRGRGVGHEVEDWLEAERIVWDEVEQSKTRPRSMERPTSRRSSVWKS